MRKRFSSATLSIAILLSFLAGVGTTFSIANIWLDKTGLSTSHIRGRDLAILVCDQCHSVLKSGKSPDQKAPPFRHLVTKLSSEGLAEQLEIALSLGHSPMPPWKLSPEQANDLLTYIIWLKDPTKN